MKTTLRIIAISLVLAGAAGCAVNPVTGERELSLVDEGWELNVGEQQYAPLRQSQGGDFVLEPEVTHYVQGVGQRLAAVSDRELPYEFQVINSSVPNAWALPGGKISVNRGLLTELESEAELAAVLGHEIVHSAARHGARQQSRAIVLQGAVLAGGIATGVATGREDYATVALVGGMIGAQLITQRYSRDAERQSDRYGMEYMKRAGYDPRGAVELQETFVRISEEHGGGGGFAGGLFASHPPSRERLENNRRTAEELGAGGRTGRDEYRQVMERLNRLQPAYAAHDAGRQALADGDHATALQKADEALVSEPGEALFHALKGDALASREDYAGAERAYTHALAQDDAWFYHHLRRGMVRHEMGRLEAARGDLAASLERLPTAQGHLLMGNVERAAGNRQAAVEHYRTAAQSDSAAGQKARQALQDMGVN